MSLLILGKTICPICGLAIIQGEDAVSFPAFVWNEADPLMLFNDASVHERCLRGHRLAEQVDSVISEMYARTGPGHRRCAVCEMEISDPNDYFHVPRLAPDASGALGRYSYLHLHRSHLRQWEHLEALLEELRRLDRAGTWKGEALRCLIKELEAAVSVPGVDLIVKQT